MFTQPDEAQNQPLDNSPDNSPPTFSQRTNLADKISGKLVDQSTGVQETEGENIQPLQAPQQKVSPPPWINNNPSDLNSQLASKEGKEETSSPEPQKEMTLQGSSGETIIKESPFKKIVPLAGIGLIVLLIFFLVSKIILPKLKGESGIKSTKSKEEITLTYWGLWEAESVFLPIIDDYRKTHQNVKINYILQSPKDYRERLQSALAKGDGPDIFRFHNTWVPMLKNDLSPAPAKIAASINLSGNYFPVVASDLKTETSTYGVPLYFDSLALICNTKIFQEAGKTPPTSWEELRKTALALTVKDSKGTIQISGVALGTTGNVEHFSDILGLMMLQNGADLTKPNDTYAADALTFYTLFNTQDHVWDETLPSSVYAFAMGKVAMILVPSWRILDIKETNPSLDFKVVPVPQLPGTQVAWATYWVEGVSKKSKNTEAAWEFLQYLSSKEVLTKLYTAESGLRPFGEPYPRIDLATQLENDPMVGAFVKQGPYAKSWYLCSRTYDNGINDRMIKYFEDAINAVVTKGTPSQDALEIVAQGVTQVLTQYKISSAPGQ